MKEDNCLYYIVREELPNYFKYLPQVKCYDCKGRDLDCIVNGHFKSIKEIEGGNEDGR